LGKTENQNYFRGPENVQRVQAWRKTHPRYWQKRRTKTDSVLQEDSLVQSVETQGKSDILNELALQELSSNQPSVLVGLIANLTGSALQDEIAQTVRQLLKLGGDILNATGGHHAHQASVMPVTGTPYSKSVQLD
jgi:hypothetical protein